MKFIVITDLHQKKSKIGVINNAIKEHSPDFVLFLGDITDMGTKEDAVEIIKMIESKVYAIPGNCDPLDLPVGISDVAINMHGNATKIGDYDLVGLGGSNITIFGTPFELEEEVIYNTLKPISKKGMILMTHAPSFGILDTIPSGAHVGCPAIKSIVDEYHPIVALSGHIHEAIGIEKIDGTLFVNPGPAREGRYAVITIDNGVAEAKLFGPTL